MVVPAGQGQIPGRQASVKGGIPHDVPVVTINKVCGSALKAVTMAAQIIRAGDADIVVAGGMESMSNIPYIAPDMRWGARMNDVKLKDAMVLDGLWCPDNDVHMAVIGGSVAGEYGISREEQDKWAYRSQCAGGRRSQGGVRRGALPVGDQTVKGVSMVVRDEASPSATHWTACPAARPVRQGRNLHRGNAPGTNDGARGRGQVPR